MEQEYGKPFLELLADQYPTIGEASNAIIKLQAKNNLPKGTEHFISDLHGEYEPFLHILKNGSGVIKRKIDDIFGNSLPEKERRSLATLIYYPEEKLEIIKAGTNEMDDEYKVLLYRLMKLCKQMSGKYTRAHLRKFIPPEYADMVDEMLYCCGESGTSLKYYESIVQSIIDTDMADAYIITISHFISRIAINRLHILGDIFDRGPGADIILDALMSYHSLDIQWGNHDILWMAAGAGNMACVANVVRICTRYDNLHTLEDGYGISTRPLVTFALDTYKNDPCGKFIPISCATDAMNTVDEVALSKIHKAIAVIQFKIEGSIAMRCNTFDMSTYRTLERVDYERGTVKLDGKEYQLNDTYFPTIDPSDPYRLTEDEEKLIQRLKNAFIHSEKLQKHLRFLYAQGSMYSRYNNNLLYHGCIPLTEKGEFFEVQTAEGPKHGKEWLDYADRMARQGYFAKPGSIEKQKGEDFLWYLWCGIQSPLFGKMKMKTFERYFIDDPEAWVEIKNPYYSYIDDEETCKRILREFGLSEEGHIINGHVPVNKGESPIHSNGRLLVIDGGLSKAYHKKTGIAGYTLVYDSYGLILSAHEPFESTQAAIEQEQDIHSTPVATQRGAERMMVRDTDRGVELNERIRQLEHLLSAYRTGMLKEKSHNQTMGE